MLPVTMTLSGTDYDVTRTQVNTETEHTPAGTYDSYEFSVSIVLDDFDTEPISGDVVTISAVDYRVLKKAEDAGGITARLDLGAKY